MEDRGLEPSDDSDVTASGQDACEFAVPDGAANALHVCGPNCPLSTLLDADLQTVVAAWPNLKPQFKHAVLLVIQTGINADHEAASESSESEREVSLTKSILANRLAP